MGEAAKRRLISALDDYIGSYSGDGGRAPRQAQAGTDADFVTAAQGLRSQLDRGSGDQPSTPGARAAKRGAEGGGFQAAADRARDMLGGAQQAGSQSGEPAVG